MRQSSCVAFVLVAAAFAAASCSDSTSQSGGSSAGGAGSTDLCAESFERAVACGEDPAEERELYLSNCQEMLLCYQALEDLAFVDAYLGCANARACGADPQAELCFELARQPFYDDPTASAAAAACEARHQECCDADRCPYDVRTCWGVMVSNDEVQTEEVACLASPCDQIETCLDDVHESRGCVW